MRARFEVFPDRTVITYSHIAFTVRQIMFAPDGMEDGTGAVVLFQVDSTRRVDLTFSFTPEMRPMWPQPTQGMPSAEWVKRDASGFYVLHTDFPNLAGAVAMPTTQPGIMAPYQEKPQFHPVGVEASLRPEARSRSLLPFADGGRDHGRDGYQCGVAGEARTAECDVAADIFGALVHDTPG